MSLRKSEVDVVNEWRAKRVSLEGEFLQILETLVSKGNGRGLESFLFSEKGILSSTGWERVWSLLLDSPYDHITANLVGNNNALSYVKAVSKIKSEERLKRNLERSVKIPGKGITYEVCRLIHTVLTNEEVPWKPQDSHCLSQILDYYFKHASSEEVAKIITLLSGGRLKHVAPDQQKLSSLITCALKEKKEIPYGFFADTIWKVLTEGAKEIVVDLVFDRGDLNSMLHVYSDTKYTITPKRREELENRLFDGKNPLFRVADLIRKYGDVFNTETVRARFVKMVETQMRADPETIARQILEGKYSHFEFPGIMSPFMFGPLVMGPPFTY